MLDELRVIEIPKDLIFALLCSLEHGDPQLDIIAQLIVTFLSFRDSDYKR